MSNIRFFPAKTISDVDAMNETELLDGYRAGLRGEKKPTESRAKWTGWRNGMVDSGRAEIDDSQRGVARSYWCNHENN